MIAAPLLAATLLLAEPTGYVQLGDVKPVDATAPPARGSRTEIVATARRFLGTPYLWGGMTVHGIDCSGFVSRVYHANGVDLLRDADLQFADPNADAVAREAALELPRGAPPCG